MNKKNWIIATLEEITEVNPTLDKTLFPDDLMVSFVPMPAVEAGTGKIDVNNTRRFSDVKKGYTPFQKDDVLFAKITPCMENGKMAVVPVVANQIGFGSTEFHVLRPRAGIDPSFVYYFISSQKFRYDAEHNMTGAVGQRRVPAQYLKTHPIPVPPFKEQKRIVAKIEELFSEIDKGVENLQKTQELLKVYRQSLLKSAFEGKLTENWRQKNKNSLVCWDQLKLKDIASYIQRGKSPRYVTKSEIPIVNQKCIRWNGIVNEFLKYQDPNLIYKWSKERYLQEDDILWNSTGTGTIGRATIYDGRINNAIVDSHVTIIRFFKDKVLPKYAFYFIMSPFVQQNIENMQTGSTNQVELSKTIIEEIVIPIPSLLEQSKIVSILDKSLLMIDILDQKIEKETRKSHNLRQTILKKAFSGSLVPQDEKYTNAILEQIRAEKELAPLSKKKTKQCQKVTA